MAEPNKYTERDKADGIKPLLLRVPVGDISWFKEKAEEKRRKHLKALNKNK